MSEPRTFVIGDVHGHLDRLEALLKKAGLLGQCEDCDGTGDRELSTDAFGGDTAVRCEFCDGDGWTRIDNHENFVVQVGDLGHFGRTGTPTGDLLCYKYGMNWLDRVLWGNHDRAVVDSRHEFSGYMRPGPETWHLVATMIGTRKLVTAHAAHGHLITHAGLHAQWKFQPNIDFDKTDPYAFADWINRKDDPLPSEKGSGQAVAVVGAIGRRRGGPSPYGGILWRDAEEKLFDGFPQVFGHSAGDKVRKYQNSPGNLSYCIDIGRPDNGRLAGIWLPDKEIVEVKI